MTNYTDAMMEAVCEALSEFEIEPWAVSNLAHDLPNAFHEHVTDAETRANVHSAMATASSLADDFERMDAAQIRALAKEVAG